MTDDANDTEFDELRARLADVDPAADLAPTDPVEVTRRLEEAMSTHDTPTNEPTRDEVTGVATEASRRGAAWLVAAAAAVLIVGTVFITQLGSDDSSPPIAADPTATSSQATVTVLQPPTAQQLNARCMVPSPETLALQQVAFLGTVTAIDDGQVSFDVDTWFAGDPTDTVQVAALPDDLVRLLNAVSFEEGQSYYVSASDGRVTVCGLTGPADAERADLYQRAFGS